MTPAAAREVVAALAARGLTLAVAESLTGGAVCDAVVAVPGASACLRGGVVAYATDVKASVLGVPAPLLAAHGPVHPEVAAAMAARVRVLFGADLGLATTGVAGPDPQNGHLPGEAYVAVADASGVVTHALEPASVPIGRDAAQARAAVRQAVVGLALGAVLARIAPNG